VGEVVDEGELTEVVEQVQPDVLILAMTRTQKSLASGLSPGALSPDEDSGRLAPEQNRGNLLLGHRGLSEPSRWKARRREFWNAVENVRHGGTIPELRHQRDVQFSFVQH